MASAIFERQRCFPLYIGKKMNNKVNVNPFVNYLQPNFSSQLSVSLFMKPLAGTKTKALLSQPKQTAAAKPKRAQSFDVSLELVHRLTKNQQPLNNKSLWTAIALQQNLAKDFQSDLIKQRDKTEDPVYDSERKPKPLTLGNN